jgi:hypothetical protein
MDINVVRLETVGRFHLAQASRNYHALVSTVITLRVLQNARKFSQAKEILAPQTGACTIELVSQ